MKDPDEHIDSETFNLLLEEQLASIMTYCLWGNIVKNPRYCSSVMFKETILLLKTQ